MRTHWGHAGVTVSFFFFFFFRRRVLGLSGTYFLRVGSQGRLFTLLEADDAGGAEETGFVKLAHTSKLLNRGMGIIHQLMPDGSSSTGRHLPPLSNAWCCR